MTIKKTICSEVITYPQYGPTCWFNALIMAILYSQHSRKLILNKAETWQKGILIFDMIKKILKTKFIRNKDYDVNFGNFNLFKPEHILKLLHKYNPNDFMVNMNKTEFKNGFLSEIYIKKLYKLLGISKITFFEMFKDKNEIYYSYYNSISRVEIDKEIIKPYIINIDKSNINQEIKDPDVILLMDANPLSIFPDYYKINDDNNVKELLSNKGKITYNNNTYVLDSIILSNWNKSIIKTGHAIAGITCNNEKYVYNGWIRSTIDPAMLKNENDINKINNNPCELMKFGWHPMIDFNFCLNPKTCYLDRIIDQDYSKFNLCFSFKRPVRLFIYIKEDAEIEKVKPAKINCKEGYEISNIKGNCVKKCNEFQVRSPTSNRCIKACPINKDRSIENNKCISKKCKDDEEVSPYSGKCVKICKKDQIRSPKTGRCTKKLDKSIITISQDQQYIQKNGKKYFNLKVGNEEYKNLPVELIESNKYTLIAVAKILKLKKYSKLTKEPLVTLIQSHLIFN